jgi:polyketide cyclase/dehydrase/lipid transport protein
MLTALTIVAVIIAISIAAILVLASTKPNTLTVQRSISIKAPLEKIFAAIDDFRRWRAWSPYEEKDPGMMRVYTGASSGTGAIYEWKGNKNVGSGRMEILETTPAKTIIKLDFFTPFEGHNTAEFVALPHGDATTLTWSMRGPAPFMSKVMQVFMNMDTMIGKDFEIGLTKLKHVAET